MGYSQSCCIQRWTINRQRPPYGICLSNVFNLFLSTICPQNNIIFPYWWY